MEDLLVLECAHMNSSAIQQESLKSTKNYTPNNKNTKSYNEQTHAEIGN